MFEGAEIKTLCKINQETETQVEDTLPESENEEEEDPADEQVFQDKTNRPK